MNEKLTFSPAKLILNNSSLMLYELKGPPNPPALKKKEVMIEIFLEHQLGPD